jgi:hypothetical protein
MFAGGRVELVGFFSGMVTLGDQGLYRLAQ